MRGRACRNCFYIIEKGSICPNCKGTSFSSRWSGKSEVARKLNIKSKGRYALSVS